MAMCSVHFIQYRFLTQGVITNVEAPKTASNSLGRPRLGIIQCDNKERPTKRLQPAKNTISNNHHNPPSTPVKSHNIWLAATEPLKARVPPSPSITITTVFAFSTP